MKKVNREHIMNTTTPDERSEKDGLAREPRELSSEELESIIGGVGIGIEIGGEATDLVVGLTNSDDYIFVSYYRYGEGEKEKYG
jgi:hypothetical protein